MKSGRNFSLEDGGANRGTKTDSPMKLPRAADPDKKRRSGRAPASPREGKTSSAVNLPEPKRKGPGAVPGSKSKIPPRKKTEDGHVSSSIKKLLSVYEVPGKSRKPDDERTKATAAKTPEEQAPSKHSSVSYDQNGRRRCIPVPTDRTKASETKVPPVRSAAGKGEETQPKRPVPRKRTIPEERKMKAAEEDDAKTHPVDDRAKEKEREQLVPILSPNKEGNNPVSLINSFISDYLDEESGNRSKSKAKMDFQLPSLEEGIGNVFPVCSKRATDNIPKCGLPEALSQDSSELIIMLRRRNSEPYSQKSCIFYGGDPERSNLPPTVGLENYLFWEPGPAHVNKPYWEVSLFKSNGSLSVCNTTTSSGSPLAPIEQSPSLIVNGHFNKSISGAIREMTQPGAEEFKARLSDVRYCQTRDGTVRALSFVTLTEKERGLPNEVKCGSQAEREEGGPARRASKDDNYKPPANLLVYVKSSKRLVALDGSASDDENCMNKKLHKITKTRGEESDARPTLRQRSLLLAVASAVLLTTAIIFFIQFVMKRPAYFNLTPPIPGLVRGC